MKFIKIASIKIAVFAAMLLLCRNAAAQAPASDKQNLAVADKVLRSADSLPENYTIKAEVIFEKESMKICSLKGYRKKLRRQMDYYLIPWELRKKHIRVC